MKKIISLLVLLIFTSQTAFSCTAVFIKKGDMHYVGRTMDWATGDGFVVVNKRGIAKKAAPTQDSSLRLKWRSNNGSVTFNIKVQFKWYIKVLMTLMRLPSSSPSCGLNEKGLWGASLWVHTPPAVVYPPKNNKPSINNWQLLEYILDTSNNVAQAIENIKKIRVAGYKEGTLDFDLHWYIADPAGNSAIIEFPDGKLRVYMNPVPPVMANSFYVHSQDYLKGYKGFGGKMNIPVSSGKMTTENRYLFASYGVQNLLNKSKISPSDVFNVMGTVTQTDARHMETSQAVTQWTTVYDLRNMELSWFSKKCGNIKTVHLGRLDFSYGSRKKKIDINSDLSGNVDGKL